ncbi:MAG: sigma-70 family RNA polymerase sigma factor [Myxococcota bacterium]
MTLYHRYGPALRRKCERMLGSREDAEDIVQNLFVDLLHAGRTDVALPYLFRAATNRCLNRLRDRTRRAALLARHGEAALGGVVPPIDGRVIDLDLLVRLVDRLDDLSAEILVLRYLDRLEQQEIADLVGRSRRTVFTRLTEIRAALAQLTGEEVR